MVLEDGGAALLPSKLSPESLLSQYFRDVSGLPVLRPAEEFDMARTIEKQEQVLWAQLLSHPRLMEPLLAKIERQLDIDSSKLSLARRTAREYRRYRRAAYKKRFERATEKLARVIRAKDVDRELLDDLITRLGRLARGESDALFPDRFKINVEGAVFVGYFEKTMELNRSAQVARNTFVQANLRLVVTISRRFNYGQIPFHDLIQEGNIGLIKAVGRYDYRRGFRFSTYASWWIRHAITRAIADKGRLVRVPVHMLSAYHKVARTTSDLSSKLGRAPTAEELGKSTSLSSQRVTQIQEQLPCQALSLDNTFSESDDRSFIEMVQDEDQRSPVDTIGDQQVYNRVQGMLSQLRPIEADVLRKRFGIADGQERTLSEIGNDYELSRERIRQIQEQALGKIRKALIRENAM